MTPAARVLQEWNTEANQGKDASFKQWTFLDTCCVSELVKLEGAGEKERVREFVRGRDILIPLTVVQELRRRPSISQRVPDVLDAANIYGFPHPTKFWDCDLWMFLNTQGIQRNVLQAFPVSSEKFRFQLGLPDALYVRAEHMADGPFRAQIERDRQEGVHEHKLVSMMWGTVNELAREQYRVDIPVADCRPENFPAVFVFYYTYYHRFLAQRRVVPEPGDFIDLTHASISPYCTDFFAEQKLVQRLRRQIKDRSASAPTPFQVAKRLFKEAHIDADHLERARRSEDMKRETSPLLADTNFVTHMEMREAVLAM